MSAQLKNANRPPIYRLLEILLLKVCEMTDRCFKRSRSLAIMNEDLIHDIRETLSFAAIALNEEDIKIKYDCITAIKMRMWVITTTLERIHFSYINKRVHFLSEELYGEMIDCINLILYAQHRWQVKYSNQDSHN